MSENKINYVEIFNEIFENLERTNSACVYAFKVEGIYLYIGTTNAFFERLKRHFKANTKIGYFLRIAYQEKIKMQIEILERSQDFTKEMQFIKQIRPKYNNHGIL